ncbi:hypothetical protein ABZ498_19580 [Streptomyces lavendulocolor]|uniref:hypothetical protein n=1 Tax=Streptomyces lavendulocolor TaxID=67316 RepID=UPI0033FB2DD8
MIRTTAEARKDLALTTLAAITHADSPDVAAILKAVSSALRETPEQLSYPLADEEIRDEGRAEGPAEGRADALLIVLEQRGVAVPDEARDRITRCGDPEQLRRRLARAVTAASVEDVFVEP